VTAYLIAFVWGICLLISFVGWGVALTRLLFGSQATVDWGLKGAWGLALTVCAGGLLNFAAAVSRTVVITWVILGLLFWLVDLASRSGRAWRKWHTAERGGTHDRRLTRVGIVVGVLAALQYAGWVYTPVMSGDSYFVFPQMSSSLVFNVHDDFHGYFVFARKMIDTGSLGQDPFSERRLNALGGQSFLQTFLLAVLPEENLHLLEPGLAILLVLGLLLGYFRERGIPARRGMWVLLAFLLVPPPYMNISALVTGLVLFIALYRTLASAEFRTAGAIRHAVLAALCAAAICTLKSSLIPAGVLFLVFGYGAVLVASSFDRRVVRAAAAAFVLTVLFLLPWMLSMYDAFGTLLYPVLGVGPRATGVSPTGASLLGNLPIEDVIEMLFDLVTSGSMVALAVCGFAWYRFGTRAETPHRDSVLSLVASSFVAALLVALLLSGRDTYRFHYPFVMAAILVSAASSLADTDAGASLRRLTTAVAASLLIGWVWTSERLFYSGLAQSTYAAITAQGMLSSHEREQYLRMQATIPAGQRLLTHLEKPFLLDFTRNPIFIVDNPGTMPPAIPEFSDGNELASYLLARSIRYVAYSYRTGAGVPKDEFDGREYYEPFFKFQGFLNDLGRTRERVYNDVDMFIVDLASTHKSLDQKSE
jgi:hypothetical protein